jgi:hypothetical protein
VLCEVGRSSSLLRYDTKRSKSKNGHYRPNVASVRGGADVPPPIFVYHDPRVGASSSGIMKRRSRQEVGGIEHHDEIDPDDVLPQKKCKRTQRLRNICLLVSALAFTSAFVAKSAKSRISNTRTTTLAISVSYKPPSNVTNPLLATFEKVMSSPNLLLDGFSSYVVLILEDKKILCRGSHKDVISKARIRAYVEMLKKGFDSSEEIVNIHKRQSVPIILIESDNSGCDNHDQIDMANFPRLTWHTPSPKHGSGWCQAISMTGYESWNSFRNMHAYHDSWFFDHTWDAMLTKYERKYPWESKNRKAIWRGSTTGMKRLEFNDTFDELPRAKLVKKSMNRPDIIDAGFTSFVQGWEELQDEDLWNQTIVSDHIPFDDLMKYKAIIDIDGNTWSSRFTKLLCTNSVVIKVR